MNNRKYLKPSIIIMGFLIFAYFGYQATILLLNPPAQQEITSAMSADQVHDLKLTFGENTKRWNNQVARKGFFSLIGMFILLLGALPKKKRWIPKIIFSFGLVTLIIHHMLADGRIGEIVEDGFKISAFWILMAFVVKGTGMWCTVWRWKVLLQGQGFKIPLRHLIESFLIGRFIGSFAPGTSGLDGYRAYDISRYTGKIARSLAVIFVEKLIGFFVLGSLLLIAIPLGSALFAEKQVNSSSLVMMGLVFVGMMTASMLVLFNPGLIRWVAGKFIPTSSPIKKKVDKAVRAVAAYEKRKIYLLKALVIGFGVHVCTIGMYFCTSRAILQVVPSADLFVTGALMIGATVIPLSIAGIGMREGVFVFFLGPVAAVYAFGGYLVGELISLLGGPVWLLRKSDYYEVMQAQRDAVNQDVDDNDELEEMEETFLEPTGPLPSLLKYSLTGALAGLLAGLGVAIVDALRLFVIGGAVDWSLPGYAAMLYGPFLAGLGAAAGAVFAVMGRIVKKPAAAEIDTGTFIGLTLFSVFTLAIGFFYLQRDFFGESVGLFSPQMLGSVLGLIVGLVGLSMAIGWLLRSLFKGSLKKFGSLFVAAGVYVVITGFLVMIWVVAGGREATGATLVEAPAKPRPNVLLVMNDTHRADYVGAYGGPKDLTPNLDAVAKDGVVFNNAFAQASWTRPSVATILTGRYASSHTAMQKGSVLPDELTTLAEVMVAGGYETTGLVTNYNLTPFFNFDQGFHDYNYLTPRLPLGATDAQSKLIIIEVAKKIAAKARSNYEVPEDYYVTGDIVTDRALERLDSRDTSRPFFMFLSYMDVHDPYFRRPLDGYAISHRANPNPDINDKELIEKMKELYSGEVKYWDTQFGRLIDGLKKRNLYDNTLIVVVSDHGEEFGEHGGFWHGTTLYDELLRIVFIVKYQTDSALFDSAGAKVDSWVRLLDVAPLIIEEAGLQKPDEMQGEGIPKKEHTTIFAEEDHQGNVISSVRYKKDGDAVKLIEANSGNPRGLSTSELYMVDKDPKETKDIATQNSALTSDAHSRLEKISAQASKGAASAKTGKLSAEQKAALKALGYMEDEK